jgi:hypothetical protein
MLNLYLSSPANLGFPCYFLPFSVRRRVTSRILPAQSSDRHPGSNDKKFYVSWGTQHYLHCPSHRSVMALSEPTL